MVDSEDEVVCDDYAPISVLDQLWRVSISHIN